MLLQLYIVSSLLYKVLSRNVSLSLIVSTCGFPIALELEVVSHVNAHGLGLRGAKRIFHECDKKNWGCNG